MRLLFVLLVKSVVLATAAVRESGSSATTRRLEVEAS